nr:hypothetical protein [Nonomuraea basaltis]
MVAVLYAMGELPYTVEFLEGAGECPRGVDRGSVVDAGDPEVRERARPVAVHLDVDRAGGMPHPLSETGFGQSAAYRADLSRTLCLRHAAFPSPPARAIPAQVLKTTLSSSDGMNRTPARFVNWVSGANTVSTVQVPVTRLSQPNSTGKARPATAAHPAVNMAIPKDRLAAPPAASSMTVNAVPELSADAARRSS